MPSPRGRPFNRAKFAHLMSTKELDSSNATSNAFLGGKQKEWMSFNPDASIPPSLAPSTRTAEESQASLIQALFLLYCSIWGTWPAGNCFDYSTAEHDTTIKGHDVVGLPFPPGYDRGRFPRDRRRRGGTKSYRSRLTPALTSNLIPLVPGSPIDAGNRQAKLFEEPGNSVHTSANSLPPSPSPTTENRRQSDTIIDLDDLEEGEQAQTHTAENATLDSTELDVLVAKFGYEKLKKRFEEMERLPTAPVQHGASQPVQQRDDRNGPLRNAGDDTNAVNETSLTLQDSPISSSATSKRSAEAVSEPTKRMQGFPKNFPPTPVQTLPGVPQHISSPRALLEAEMHDFHRKASQRLRSLDAPDRPGVDYERSRIGLLRAACGHSDFFYLRLHQLFCVDYMYRSSGHMTPFLEKAHRDGLDVLSYLLVSNEKLSTDGIEWFSSFPLPWEILHPSRPGFHSANVRVSSCLAKLASTWETLRQLCMYRGYPPLVEEMFGLFGVESFTFQQVVFLALLREIWKGPQDDCYQLTEKVFPRNYRETMNRRSRDDLKDGDNAYKTLVISEFKRIALYHVDHMQPYQGSMLPPQQRRSSLVQDKGDHHGSQSLSTNPLQRRLRPLQTSLTTPAPSPFSTNLHSQPSVIPGAPVRRSSSSHQSLIVDTTNAHGASLTQSPTTLPGLHGPSMSRGYHPSHHVQTQQRINSHSATAMPILPSSMPSEIIGELAQSVPKVLPAQQVLPLNLPSHQNLPSNVTIRGANNLQQRSSTPPLLQSAQSHGSSGNSHPPSGPRRQYEAQRQRLDRSQQPQTYQIPQQNHTQFIRENPHITLSQVSPTRNALHQAHVRSPVLKAFDHEGKPLNTKKTFRFINDVLMPPGEVSSEKRYMNWEFNIEKALADSFIRDTPGSYGSPPVRTLVPGSRLCRIRCIKLDRASGMPSQHEWVVSDNVWHSSTAIVLNGKALEIRKKVHHGKDLPIDATPFVKEGINSISTAVIGFSEDSVTRYAIGIEIVEVIEEQLIRHNITVLPWQEALKRMSGRSGNLDPEVQIIDSRLVIDLKDPFSAQLFAVPVRGAYCRHNQCFDRDTFLETRNSKNEREPCGPDEFRCPICGSDARPQNLVIDGFLTQVRENLQEKGRLDAKAIILHPSGHWEIKEDEGVTGEQGDGSGMRSAQQFRPPLSG